MGLTKTCLECGGIGNFPEEYSAGQNPTILGWFRICKLKLTYRANKTGTIPNPNRIWIEADTDNELTDSYYHFCSQKCIVRWLTKELDKIEV